MIFGSMLNQVAEKLANEAVKPERQYQIVRMGGLQLLVWVGNWVCWVELFVEIGAVDREWGWGGEKDGSSLSCQFKCKWWEIIQ